MYEIYKNDGLFEQNFRYYIKQKVIDDEIKKSIRNKKQIFWYLNNGIIIGAKSYKFDGYNIVLEDFSIINGCQTTTLIGETDGISEQDDFLIHCKIIASEKKGSAVEIADIAAASNSQKPIGVRDLKANKPEQIRIKQELAALQQPIYMEIKRGEEKKKTTFKWQNISNEYYAQLIASFVYQIPGTARSLKAKLFQDDSIYNKIFRNYHRPEFVYEIVLLANDYDIYKKEFETNDAVDEAIVSQGKFIHLAIIGFLQKYFAKKIDIAKMKKESEEWVKEISANDVNKVFSNNYEFDETVEMKKTSLFQLISYELKNLYDIRFSKNEETSVSNYFKRDKRYQEIILEHMKRRLIDTPTEKEKLRNYMSIFFIE
jgi:sRNA-binding regulator protein Hfq